MRRVIYGPKLGLEDLERVLEIERASFGPDAYDRNLFAVLRAAGDLFLAVGARAGSVRVFDGVRTGRGRAELVSIAVDPPSRGQGAGSFLMESALAEVAPRGVARFSLMVKVSNREAQACYAKFGFRKVRRVRSLLRGRL